MPGGGWQLPERTFAGHLSAWGLYVLHQLILWGLILTQMQGLGLSRAVRAVLLGAYLAAAAAVYAPLGLGRLNEIIRIPFIDYLGVLLIAGGISLGLRMTRRLKARTT